jgi:esterase/lipase superfamily enzyme
LFWISNTKVLLCSSRGLSRGELLSYEWDRNSALFARSHFIELIKLMEREAGIKKIHVIAHSMGNFVALDALSTYAQTTAPLSIGQVVMAAPDIDADQYKQDVGNLAKIVGGMTLYASDKDAVILASRTLAQGPRAGDLVNGSPILAPGVDAIDVSAIGSEELGIENHDTFATKRSVIDDIKLVLAGVRPPTSRLSEIRGVPEGASNPTYWRYAP